STSMLVRDGEGRIVGIQASGRNVSERVAAQHALAQSDKNFRAMLEQLPTPVIIRRGVHAVYANPSFVRLLGYEHSDTIVGRDVRSCVAPEDLPVLEARLHNPGRMEPTPEHRLIRADGGTVVVKVSGIPV